MRYIGLAAAALLSIPFAVQAQDEDGDVQVINLTENLSGKNEHPRLAVDPNKGNVMVVWENNGNIYSLSRIWKNKKQIYRVKGPRLVSPPSGTHRRPDVAWMNPKKQFIAVWDNWPDDFEFDQVEATPAKSRRSGPAATASDILGRVLRKSAKPKGDVIQLYSDGRMNVSPAANTVRSTIPEWEDRSFSLGWFNREMDDLGQIDFELQPMLYRQFFDAKVRDVTDAELMNDYFTQVVVDETQIAAEIISSDTFMRDAGDMDASLEGYLYSEDVYATAVYVNSSPDIRRPFFFFADTQFFLGDMPLEMDALTVLGATQAQRIAGTYALVPNVIFGEEPEDAKFLTFLIDLDITDLVEISIDGNILTKLMWQAAPVAHVNFLPQAVEESPAIAGMPDYKVYDLVYVDFKGSLFHMQFNGQGLAEQPLYLEHEFFGSVYDGRAEVVPNNEKIVAVFEVESPEDPNDHDIYMVIFDKPNPDVIATPR